MLGHVSARRARLRQCRTRTLCLDELRDRTCELRDTQTCELRRLAAHAHNVEAQRALCADDEFWQLTEEQCAEKCKRSADCLAYEHARPGGGSLEYTRCEVCMLHICVPRARVCGQMTRDL